MTSPILASTVEPEDIEFLWNDRLPIGMTTVVAGRPGQGKGLFAAHVAGCVSAAGGNVLYSAIEDSDEQLTAPRLEAAGADMDRVHLWEFRMPTMLGQLEEQVRRLKIDLVVIDPL